jgi:hypothetical protein
VGPSQTKDFKIGISSFSAKQAALRSKGKDWFTRNQDNVSGQPKDYKISICSFSAKHTSLSSKNKDLLDRY